MKNALTYYNDPTMTFTEEFDEKAYSHKKVLEWLEKTDFEFVECFKEMTEEKPDEETQRLIYIARKK